MFGLSQIQRIAIVGLLIAVLVGGAISFIRHEGEVAGSSNVKVEVQQETIRTLDAARISKERTDEEVHRTPYGDRADGLR